MIKNTVQWPNSFLGRPHTPGWLLSAVFWPLSSCCGFNVAGCGGSDVCGAARWLGLLSGDWVSEWVSESVRTCCRSEQIRPSCRRSLRATGRVWSRRTCGWEDVSTSAGSAAQRTLLTLTSDPQEISLNHMSVWFDGSISETFAFSWSLCWFVVASHVAAAFCFFCFWMFLQPSTRSHDMDRCGQVLQGRRCLEALFRPSVSQTLLQSSEVAASTSLYVTSDKGVRAALSCGRPDPWTPPPQGEPLWAEIEELAFHVCFSTCRTERVSQTAGGRWREVTDEKMLRQSQKKGAAWDVEPGIWCVWGHLKINHSVLNLQRQKPFGSRCVLSLLLWMLKTCFMLISVSVALWLLLFTGGKCSHLVTVLMAL